MRQRRTPGADPTSYTCRSAEASSPTTSIGPSDGTQNGRPHLDDVVGPNGEEEPIEPGVMELAQRDAVADDWLALGVAVGRDMRRVQELLMAQSAVGASLGVRGNQPLRREASHSLCWIMPTSQQKRRAASDVALRRTFKTDPSWTGARSDSAYRQEVADRHAHLCQICA